MTFRASAFGLFFSIVACTVEAPRSAITSSEAVPIVRDPALAWVDHGKVTGSRTRGLDVRFDARGVRLSGSDGAWSGALEVTRFGCADHLFEVPAVTPERNARGTNGLSYRRRAGFMTFTESWTNEASGLEQRFTLERSPCREQGGIVRFETTARRLGPELVTPEGDPKGTSEVLLRDDRGRVRAHYSDLHATDALGRDMPVLLSVNGDRIDVDVRVDGARFPIVVDPLVWGVEQELMPSNTAASYWFGNSVSLSGNTALVGASLTTIGKTIGEGDAFVFVRTGAKWAQQGKPLVASDGHANEGFGTSVSVDGDTALIGAPGTGTDGQGAVYVFVRNGTTWTQQGSPIVSPNGNLGDGFGTSVCLSGDTALVGATTLTQGSATQGGAYVFVRNGATWSQQGDVLLAPDGEDADQFGFSVSVAGDIAVVGGPVYYSTSRTGFAYVYERSGTAWSEQARLTAPDAAVGDRFGNSVSLSGDTAVIGAPGASVGGNAGQGAVDVFVTDGTAWALQSELTAPDGAAGDSLGAAVAVSGNAVLAGAPSKLVGNHYQQGGAYAFDRAGSTWALDGDPLAAADGWEQSYFGMSVAVSGDSALIGSEEATLDNALVGGVAYALVLGGAACTANSDCSTGYCVDGFCCNTPCTGSCAACAKSLGAAEDGVCAFLSPGSMGRSGRAMCSAPKECTGASSTCALCADDTQCPSGTYCYTDGTCKPQKAQGSACADTAFGDCHAAPCGDCASPGGCVDGFCCDAPCDDACGACAVSRGATADGTCTPLPAGTTTDSCSDPYSCNGVSTYCQSCSTNADCAFMGGECKNGACVEGPDAATCDGSACFPLADSGAGGASPTDATVSTGGGVVSAGGADATSGRDAGPRETGTGATGTGGASEMEGGSARPDSRPTAPSQRFVGCSCRSVGERGSPASLFGAGAVGLLLGVRARRRPRSVRARRRAAR